MSSLKVGIVGLPNVGKSTLFNALLKKRVALSANYPFATIEPNTGVVAVADDRLLKLAKLVAKEEGMIPPEILEHIQDSTFQLDTSEVESQIQKYLPPIVPAIVEFVDIAGLVKGASTGAGLGNQFLSHIREVDAVIHVLRDFEDANVVREGSTNPKSDREVVETELALSDLQTLEKLIAAQEKLSKISKDQLELEKLQVLTSLKNELEQGHKLGSYQIGDERLKDWFTKLPLLTIKPVLYVFNVSESGYNQSLQRSDVTDHELVICAKLEEELTDLSEGERKDYLSEMGIKETGLERLIKKAYTLLGLVSFLTAGKKEVRAWTIKTGTKAPQAAGVIHTDFEKGFIRAQVIEYEKLIEAGSYAQAKSKGWIRTEGRDYEIKDGNIVEFLVSS
ncbi:redox-regulated ATPase YchF [Candidatus Daviesbacteria bacterium]|nr:redox-regulated ATPase YchF [Candidatus Daviesbacteria bacterium]